VTLLIIEALVALTAACWPEPWLIGAFTAWAWADVAFTAVLFADLPGFTRQATAARIATPPRSVRSACSTAVLVGAAVVGWLPLCLLVITHIAREYFYRHLQYSRGP